MQRIRSRYTKEDRVRFVSARDLTSVWERALRRADLPIAYSEGFTPHAKVSFPDALPVGFASTGEYAELTFAAPIDPGRDLGRLSQTLPEGMDITTYVEVPEGAHKLAASLSATLWELVYPADAATDLVDRLRDRVEQVLDADIVTVVRHRPDGDRTIDVRPALVAASAWHHDSPRASSPSALLDPDRITILRAVLRNDGPTVRPTDLHVALTAAPHPDGPLPEPRLYRRLAQGSAVAAGVREALTGEVVALDPQGAAEAA